MDLIERQAAIDAILAVTGNSSVRELYEHVQEHGLSDMWSGGVNAAIDIIIAVPSAQPEQKKGKWIKKMRVTETEKYISYDPDWYCACCGAKYDPHIAKIVNFCYVCGADMRGEQDG